MKQLLLCVFLVVSTTSIASADSMMIQSPGATTVTVSGSSITMYSNPNFNGWVIKISTGSSFAPGMTPYGLDLTAFATCAGGACLTNPLNVFYSDTGFTGPVAAGGFQTTYSATIT